MGGCTCLQATKKEVVNQASIVNSKGGVRLGGGPSDGDKNDLASIRAAKFE